MTMQSAAVRRRRAVAAAGAVSAGLLVLSACDKPTPMSTVTVGSDSVTSEALCYNDGDTLKAADIAKCQKDEDVKSIKVGQDETVRIGVDQEIADQEWTVLMNGRAISDPSESTYRTVPGSVFFNAQYGAQGDSTVISVKAGGDKDVTGLWSFKLEKDY
ncbi:DUF2771 family protein [Streptomyces sp. NPDC006997]|uniref:DUF2771 family protein n=1 Tax=Streptomyces sp. NPDC006997 TaxID=3155356 RepID=UPI0034092AE5